MHGPKKLETCARDMRRRAGRGARPRVQEGRRRWCLPAPTGGRSPTRAYRPSSAPPCGAMRRSLPISAASTWHWWACRWISASPTGRRAARAARGAGDRAHRALSPRASPGAARRAARSADVGDVPFRSRFSLEDSHAGHRGVLRQGRRGRRGAAERRRRPFDQPADPQGAGRRPAARHGAHRCALRHERRPSRAPSSITAGRSGRRCWPACSTPSAPSRSASAAAPSICGSSPTTAA